MELVGRRRASTVRRPLTLLRHGYATTCGARGCIRLQMSSGWSLDTLLVSWLTFRGCRAPARSLVAASHRAQQCQYRVPDVIRDWRWAAVEPCIDRIRWHILVSRLLVSVLVSILNGLVLRCFRRIHNTLASTPRHENMAYAVGQAKRS